jgi:hypothetical protein
METNNLPVKKSEILFLYESAFLFQMVIPSRASSDMTKRQRKSSLAMFASSVSSVITLLTRDVMSMLLMIKAWLQRVSKVRAQHYGCRHSRKNTQMIRA